MKIDEAYQVLATFLLDNDAGMLEQLALKTLKAQAKGMETKHNNRRNAQAQQAMLEQPQYSTPTGHAAAVPTQKDSYGHRTKASRVDADASQFKVPTNQTQGRGGELWTKDEESALRDEYCNKKISLSDIAAMHGRTYEAIAKRLVRIKAVHTKEDIPEYVQLRQKDAAARGYSYTGYNRRS